LAKADFVVDYLPEGSLSVAFPYDSVALQIIKAVPGRRWHKEQKFWTIPRTGLRTLHEQAGRLGIGVALSERVRQALNMGRERQAQLATAKEDTTPLNLPTATQPMPFQYAGIRFAKYALHNFKGALIADDMGLGKTLQALSIVTLHERLQNVLVLCPATLKYTWAAEIEKHYPHLSYTVINGTAAQRRDLWAAESRLKVANYEVLLRDPEPRYALWDLIIADECLAPETSIETEYGPISIRKIVENRLPIRVWSYNKRNNLTELRMITNWSKVPQYSPLVHIGPLYLTGNHDFITNRENIPARDLVLNGGKTYNIVRIKNYGMSRQDVRTVRQRRSERLQVHRASQPILYEEMLSYLADVSTRASSKGIYSRTKPESFYCTEEANSGRPYLCLASCRKGETDFTRSFETEMGPRRWKREISKASKISNERGYLEIGGEWETPFLEAREVSQCFGLGKRVCSSDKSSPALADKLQDRCCEPGITNSYRSGQLAQPSEDSMVQGEWVDAAAFLQQNGGGLDGGLSSDGYVYNITVEGNHNYFANGILVANCAAYLKSYRAQRTKQAKKLHRRYSLGLSGIPLENNLDELHSVMDFIIPGLLGPGWLFHQQHAVKDPWGNIRGWRGVNEVRERIAPYYIRRTKSEVLKELPDKIYNNVAIEMTGREWDLYNTIKEQIKEKIAENPKLNVANLLVEILRLKQATCDPRLLDVFNVESSKVAAIQDIMQAAGEHKVVFFTQFSQFARILADELEAPVIDGDVPPEKRQEIIDHFQAGENRCLISTEAGAYGITLTAADIIVHVDQSWNPAKMRQREDRLHRIGQKNAVQVVNLICRRTVDEKVQAIIHRKLGLIKAVLDEQAPEDDALQLTKGDLLQLLED